MEKMKRLLRKIIRFVYKRKRVCLMILGGIAILMICMICNYLKADVSLYKIPVFDIPGHDVEEVIYSDNYSDIYGEQLRLIFGPTLQISEKETQVQEGEDCSCGYHSDTVIWDEWTITYEDEYGQIYIQTMDNRNDFARQQFKWLNRHLEQYTNKKYIFDYYEPDSIVGVVVEEEYGDSYSSINIITGVGMHTSETEKRYEKNNEKGDKYYRQICENLRTAGNYLPIYQMTLQDACTQYPIEVDFFIDINNKALSGAEKEAFEKKLQEEILQMMRDINEETESKCCIRVKIGGAPEQDTMYDGSYAWWKYCIQGEEYRGDHHDFEYEVFDSYNGIYW